jgi:hypothetical protein
MQYYLIVLVVVTMAAGARTMFEIAYQGMALEHDAAPNPETYFLIAVAFWFVIMMIANVLIITNKGLKYRNPLIALLSLGILCPIIYMLINSK